MQGVLTEEQSRQIAEEKRKEEKEVEEKSKSSLLAVNNSSPFSKSTSEPGKRVIGRRGFSLTNDHCDNIAC